MSGRRKLSVCAVLVAPPESLAVLVAVDVEAEAVAVGLALGVGLGEEAEGSGLGEGLGEAVAVPPPEEEPLADGDVVVDVGVAVDVGVEVAVAVGVEVAVAVGVEVAVDVGVGDCVLVGALTCSHFWVGADAVIPACLAPLADGPASEAAATPKLAADMTMKPPAAMLITGRTYAKRMKVLPCCSLLPRNEYSVWTGWIWCK